MRLKIGVCRDLKKCAPSVTFVFIQRMQNATLYEAVFLFLILYSLVQSQMSKKYRSTKEQFRISAITTLHISIFFMQLKIENTSVVKIGNVACQ